MSRETNETLKWQARLSRFACECRIERNLLIEANDKLEDTISRLRAELRVAELSKQAYVWNRDKLIQIGRLAGSAI